MAVTDSIVNKCEAWYNDAASSSAGIALKVPAGFGARPFAGHKGSEPIRIGTAVSASPSSKTAMIFRLAPSAFT